MNWVEIKLNHIQTVEKNAIYKKVLKIVILKICTSVQIVQSADWCTTNETTSRHLEAFGDEFPDLTPFKISDDAALFPTHLCTFV